MSKLKNQNQTTSKSLHIDNSGIQQLVSKIGIQQLMSCVNEAKEVWLDAMTTMKKIEEKAGSLMRLNEKPKLYALDAVAVAKTLGIGREKRMKASKVFSLYYLAVHLIDDAIEDKEKLRQKFNKGGNKILQDEIVALITSFILNLNLSIISLLEEEKPERVNDYLRKANLSLNRQMKYFMAEKKSIMTPREVLNVKQHSVSGEATSFIIESLKVVGTNFYEKESNLKKALFWMGSLTQFTDDLRDLENDREKGNLNLIIAIEKELKNIEGVKKKLARMYVKEEQEMVSCLELSKVNDIEIFKAIPWHPFFMKHLA